MTDLKLKFNELVDLMNASMRKHEIALQELSSVQAKKDALFKEMASIEKRIVDLKDINSELNTKVKSDKNELERLININKGKMSDLEKKEAEINKLDAQVKADAQAFKNKENQFRAEASRIKSIESEINKRMSDADEKLKIAEEKEKSALNAIAKAEDLEKSARLKISESKKYMEEVAKLRAENDAILSSLDKSKSLLADKEKEVERQRASLVIIKEELAKREESVVYRELEINKVIKDKELGKDLADKAKFDSERNAFNAECDRKLSLIVEQRNQVESVMSEIKKREANSINLANELEAREKELEIQKKKLDDGIVALELEKSSATKTAESLKNKEGVIAAKEAKIKKMGR